MSRAEFDVLVVGAGSAGASAAITAARHGARTLLVDRLAFMGGTSTAVLDTFYAFYTPGFSFGRFVRAYPDKVHDVTAVLVGDVFRPEVKKLFEPLSTMVPIPESTPLDQPRAARAMAHDRVSTDKR